MSPKEPTTQVAFRLATRLIERIDRHVERMARENPGVEFTRVDAVRVLLSRALEAAEAADHPTKRKS